MVSFKSSKSITVDREYVCNKIYDTEYVGKYIYKLDVNWNVSSHCISYAVSQENRGGNLEFFGEDWYVGGTDTLLFRLYS
jgi:hypothetical protein